MDDLDDYFVDDIALDDNTLALLDQEEQKYLTSQNNTFLDAPPVSKKRKTISGWRPGPGSHSDNADDDDNLPEISIQGDGTYGVRDVIRTSNLLSTVDVDKSLNFNATAATKTLSRQMFSTGLNNSQQQQSADGTRMGNMSTSTFRVSSPQSRQHNHLEQQFQQLQRRLQEVGVGNMLVKIKLSITGSLVKRIRECNQR